MQPFVIVAKGLLQCGHRVRLVTHEKFRAFVHELDEGIEFFDLGGALVCDVRAIRFEMDYFSFFFLWISFDFDSLSLSAGNPQEMMKFVVDHPKVSGERTPRHKRREEKRGEERR